jgi:hypothetical protein
MLKKTGKNLTTIIIMDNKDKKMGPAKTALMMTVALNERAGGTAPAPAAAASKTTTPAAAATAQAAKPAAAQASAQAASTAQPQANPLVGAWTGTWLYQTTTFTYSSYTFNDDSTYSFEGTFKESRSGVAGTLGGSGTYDVDQSSQTFTTNGTYFMQCTEGPSQYYPLFNQNLQGPAQWSYSFSGGTMTIAQSANGTAMNFTRK